MSRTRSSERWRGRAAAPIEDDDDDLEGAAADGAELIPVHCGRCETLLGQVLIESKPGESSMSYHGRQPAVRITGDDIAHALCGPCAAALTRWIAAGKVS